MKLEFHHSGLQFFFVTLTLEGRPQAPLAPEAAVAPLAKAFAEERRIAAALCQNAQERA